MALSYDGKGINGPDEYRSRLATFTNVGAASRYGSLFAAAPELLKTLQQISRACDPGIDQSVDDLENFISGVQHLCQVAIAEAFGELERLV